MLMIIGLLLGTFALELLMFYPRIWKTRIMIVACLTLLVPASTAILLFRYPNWLAIAFALVSVGRLFNILRIAEGRMREEYLRRATQRTSRIAYTEQLILLAIIIGLPPVTLSLTHIPMLVAVMQLICAAIIVVITIRSVYKSRYKQGVNFYADRELPTVTVAIPARNESQDLDECLRSVIASDYPKLEIIVLDDDSHGRIPDVIKQFAHDGVRFVQGNKLTEHWLAKNQAYEKLYQESSGELILFCGVDVRFGPNAIKALVTELLNRDKQMISVLPRRLSGSLAGAFVQPMRYWWELSLPRVLFNRPAVLSSAWLVRRQSLKKLGGFNAVSHSIIPEGYFAREFVKSNNYSFIRANDTLDIQTFKTYAQQLATAVRVRYPQLRRRPENVLTLVTAELVILLGPFIGVIYGLTSNNHAVLVLSICSVGLLILNHLIIVQLTSPANVIIALFNLPVEILTEGVIALMSMYKYEFGTVIWKERDVTQPVMHVVPHLPEA